MSERDLLLITPDFPPNRGGVARYLSLFAKHFEKRIRVISVPVSSANDVQSSFPILRKPLLSNMIWPKWLTAVQLLRKESTDARCVITSHVLPFGTAAMFAKRFTHKPYVVIVHGMDVRLAIRSKKTLTKNVLSNAHLVIANTNALAAELQQTFGLQNILVVYPPIDPSFLNITNQKMPSANVRFLTVSRLVERKGHERVIQALAILKMNGSLLNFHYSIVGEGPKRTELETLVAELELSSYITFHGDISDEKVRDEYTSADIFVMPIKDDPIDKEGFGMAYIEAAAFAVPSIATRVSGVDEAIVDGETGMLIEDGNIEQLANTMLQLAQNAELRTRLGIAAQTRAKTQFTSEAQFSKIDPYLV